MHRRHLEHPVVVPSGSMTYDTPARTRTLGGACTYFATAASLYARVRVVAVVGTDFPQEHTDFMSSRGVDLSGLQTVEGKTFFWAGRYGEDLNDCETLDTQLNVFADFHPVISPEQARSEFVFLANIDPDLQIEVLEQMRAPRLTALDSMNYWITSKRDSLAKALSMVDIASSTNTRYGSMPTNESDPRRAPSSTEAQGAGHQARQYGAMLVTALPGRTFFLSPAYPLECVVDPTGAGDTLPPGSWASGPPGVSPGGVASRRGARHGVGLPPWVSLWTIARHQPRQCGRDTTVPLPDALILDVKRGRVLSAPRGLTRIRRHPTRRRI